MAELMTLEEVAEAIGMRIGRLRQTARELFDPVMVKGRMKIPEEQVIDLIRTGAVWAIGGRHISPKYQALVGEGLRIKLGRQSLQWFLDSLSGLSGAGMAAVLHDAYSLRELVEEFTQAPQQTATPAPHH